MKIPSWLQKVWKAVVTGLQIWDWVVWGVGLLLVAATVVWAFLRDMGPVVVPIVIWTVIGFFVGRNRLAQYMATRRLATKKGEPLGSQDQEKFYQQVFIYKAEVDLTSLDKKNPFLLFTFFFFNGSFVNHIHFEKISGRVRVNEEEQSQEVQFFGDMSGNYGFGCLGFRIRQWLTDVAAKAVQQMIDGPGEVQFRFDAVDVRIIRYGDENKSEFHLNLPTISKRDGRTWVAHI